MGPGVLTTLRAVDRPSERLVSRPAWIVGAVAAAVRLVWVFVAARTPTGLSDPLMYWGFGGHIADGDGYRTIRGTLTSYYPPGYPYFVGVLRWVSDTIGLGDRSALVVGIVQALLGGVAAAAVVVAGTRLGRAWSRPCTVGLAAGLVLALWPNLVVYSAAILSESLFICLFAVFLAAALTMADDAGSLTVRPLRATVAALSLGAATLVRPQVLLVAAALGIAWALGRVGWRPFLVRGAVLGAGVLVMVAPWTVRNAGVFDALVPVSTNGGDNLCVGFHEGAPGYFWIPPACDTGEFYIDGPEAELRRNQETRARAVAWIREHPLDIPVLSLKKLWYTYRSDTDGLRAVESYGADRFLGGWRGPLRVISTVAYLAIMAASLVGAVLTLARGWTLRRTDATALAVFGAAVASFLVPVIVFGDPRFKLPGAPCFALLAGVAIAAGLDALRSRRGRPVEATTERPGPVQDRSTIPSS